MPNIPTLAYPISPSLGQMCRESPCATQRASCMVPRQQVQTAWMFVSNLALLLDATDRKDSTTARMNQQAKAGPQNRDGGVSGFVTWVPLLV